MKIWYCSNCGYEVSARGRCHACKERLVASALPQLEPGDEEDEVGYRLGDWGDRQRGRLIQSLNDLEVLHRFEEDELVVGAEDEARVDDLMADLAANAGTADEDEIGSGDGDLPDDDGPVAPPDPSTLAALRLLAEGAHRLRRDPTDMQADAAVAEASTAVFLTDVFYGTDAETWAAVGRVTRRLLGALGAEEALEDEITAQAGVLDKLLTPLLEDLDRGETPPLVAEAAAVPEEAEAQTADGDDAPDDEDDDDGEDGGGDEHGEDGRDGEDGGPDETVYELPEWLPEQRAELGLLLEESGIGYDWDGDDLVVPAARESEVEALFTRVGSIPDDEDDDDGEARYHVIEEVFAATGRLAADPDSEERMADLMEWVGEVQGPAPIGMDEVYWFRITSHARALAEAVEGDGGADVISAEATALHELLRTVV